MNRLSGAILLLLCLGSVLGPPLLAQEEESGEAGPVWLTNLDAALAEAKAKGKDVLLNFSGSDWCGWCIRLDDEVLSKPGFLEEAPKRFVLCNLDFPRRKPNPDKEANEAVSRKYKIRGFPTVLLLDADGRVFGRTGYKAGGDGPYIEHLTGLLDQKAGRDRLLAALAGAGDPAAVETALAEMVSSFQDWQILPFYAKDAEEAVETAVSALEGEEAQAGALGRFLALLDVEGEGGGSAVTHFRGLLEKAVALDPENARGLKAKYLGRAYEAVLGEKDAVAAEAYAARIREFDPDNAHGLLEIVFINAEIQKAFNEKAFEEAAEKAEAFLETKSPKKRGDVLYWAAGIARAQTGEKEKAKEHLKKLLELYPDSPMAARAKHVLQQLEQ